MNPHTPIALVSQARFERAKLPPARDPSTNPVDWVQRLIGRHCAGLAQRPDGAALYSHLLNEPPNSSNRSPAKWAAYAVLGKCTPAEIIDLMSFGRIPPARIAAHLRALGVNNQPVIRFLNQFAP